MWAKPALPLGREGTEAEAEIHADADADVDAGADADADADADAEELEWLRGHREGVGAVWDVWSAADVPKLVEFLRDLARADGADRQVAHPLHEGSYYLDAALRRRLRHEKGVHGYRFLQGEGDAVFLPAGCAHQVLNLRSCISVASGFVSPEHVGQCLVMTEQRRALPRGHRHGEDTLGVKDVLMHAISHAHSIAGEEMASARALLTGSEGAAAADAESEMSDDSFAGW